MREDKDMSENTEHRTIRGSVAWVPVLTGVVVALGAMLLLSAAVGAVLVVVDALPVDSGEEAELGIGGSIALVLGLFLSYVWGGYTAGRMARGQGVRNGLLVAVGALLVALAAAGGARAADLNTNLNVPWTSDRLPIEEEVIVDWGILLGVASLLAMAAGGAYGGYRGVRWHSALEQKELERTADDRTSSDETPVRPRTGIFAPGERAEQAPPPPPEDTESPDTVEQDGPAATGTTTTHTDPDPADGNDPPPAPRTYR